MKISLPIVPLLGITFVILKLCSVIAWSWWWVLAPFWIPLAIGLAFGALAMIGARIFTRAEQ